MMKLQQEEEEFWQLAEGLTKPGSVELYFDMLSSRFSQIQADTEKHEDELVFDNTFYLYGISTHLTFTSLPFYSGQVQT